MAPFAATLLKVLPQHEPQARPAAALVGHVSEQSTRDSLESASAEDVSSLDESLQQLLDRVERLGPILRSYCNDRGK
jgi:hypothetical protein